MDTKKKKKPGVAILISDKIDFEIKAVIREKEGHYQKIKGSIQEEDIKIINTYAPNRRAPQYVRQMPTSMKGEINSNTIIVGDFNTPLTPMDRSMTDHALITWLSCTDDVPAHALMTWLIGH